MDKEDSALIGEDFLVLALRKDPDLVKNPHSLIINAERVFKEYGGGGSKPWGDCGLRESTWDVAQLSNASGGRILLYKWVETDCEHFLMIFDIHCPARKLLDNVDICLDTFRHF